MELSALHVSTSDVVPAQPDDRCCDSNDPTLKLFNVPVPADLRCAGESVRASAIGDPSLSPVVVLGGISADCFPGLRPGGRQGWWADLVGKDCAVDPSLHYVIGVDFAADETGCIALSTFDQARVVAAALDAIGIDQPSIIVGASYGGMVALALAETEPARVRRLVIVSASAEAHPAATAARDLQRRVVALGMACGRGPEALAIARGMAMLTYRTPAEFATRFAGGIGECGTESRSEPGSYLRARGEAFLSVMSPGRFLSLSASIDRHCINPAAIGIPCLLIGATSDQLVTADQLRLLADGIAGLTELHLLDSLFGHDMFLKEAGRIGELVRTFLDSGA